MDWQAEDRQPNVKNTEWYLAVGIIVLAIVVTSVIFNNILLAILIIVAFVAIILNQRRENQILDISVLERGIKVNDLFYPYESLDSFYVDEERDLLILKSKKFFSSHIMIPLSEEVSVPDLQDILDEFLEEEEMRESVLEQFMEYLGF